MFTKIVAGMVPTINIVCQGTLFTVSVCFEVITWVEVVMILRVHALYARSRCILLFLIGVVLGLNAFSFVCTSL